MKRVFDAPAPGHARHTDACDGANRTGMEALAQKHLPLGRRIAWHSHGTMSSIVEVEDLIQIGLVALVEAAAAFEDRGQVTFEQYLATRVRGAMIDELRRQATLTRGEIGRASCRERVCQYV